jgi:hypothetical protein
MVSQLAELDAVQPHPPDVDTARLSVASPEPTDALVGDTP